MSITIKRLPGEPRTVNATNLSQVRRMFAAGCPEILLTTVGHHVSYEPIALGRLWDIAHRLGLRVKLSTALTSPELVEALVTEIENHLKDRTK